VDNQRVYPEDVEAAYGRDQPSNVLERVRDGPRLVWLVWVRFRAAATVV